MHDTWASSEGQVYIRGPHKGQLLCAVGVDANIGAHLNSSWFASK